ncbi:MAG: quinone oxidoreductase family protein [Pseudomonadota bacterium]
MKTNAVVALRHGGPEVLEWREMDLPDPGPGEIRIDQTAVGLNFADIYARTGQFSHVGGPELPSPLGAQGAGTVGAVGEGVTRFGVGDRVSYAGVFGAYMESRNIPAERAVATPDDISDELAAAALLRGMTAEYLLRRLFPVKPGDRILVHAAAGGVGLILCQWGKALGAHVIGTVGSPEKAELVRANGCDDAILYREEDFVARVAEITDGRGVDVVYDSVGKDTFAGSLACLRPRGMAINYGTASGQATPLALQDLHARSLIVTRPTLPRWVETREELEASSAAVWQVLRDGAVTLPITGRFALKDTAEAHRALESRATTGALVLTT